MVRLRVMGSWVWDWPMLDRGLDLDLGFTIWNLDLG